MNLLYKIGAVALQVVVLQVASCQKTEKKKLSGDIRLKEKSVTQVRAAITGKWQLHYSYGGITGHTRVNHNNAFVNFTPKDSVLWVENGKELSREKLTYMAGTDQMNEKTVILNPLRWGVDGIYRDTLKVYDIANDGMTHYLTRAK